MEPPLGKLIIIIKTDHGSALNVLIEQHYIIENLKLKVARNLTF